MTDYDIMYGHLPVA